MNIHKDTVSRGWPLGLTLLLAVRLLLPGLHHWSLAHGGADGHEHCCGCHCPAASTPEHQTPADDGHRAPEPQPHNPANCPLCQLACMPIDAVTIEVAAPSTEATGAPLTVPALQPHYSQTRLLPYSQGPPAGTRPVSFFIA